MADLNGGTVLLTLIAVGVAVFGIGRVLYGCSVAVRAGQRMRQLKSAGAGGVEAENVAREDRSDGGHLVFTGLVFVVPAVGLFVAMWGQDWFAALMGL